MARLAPGLFRDLIIHPGETLREALDDRNMTQKQLAANVGMTEQHVSRVIKGKTNISGPFAKKLEYALGIPASFWMNLQKNYDLELAEYEDRNNITDREYDIYSRISTVLKDIFAVRDEEMEADKTFGVIQARKLFKLSSLENIAAQRSAIAYRASKAVDIDEYVAFAWHTLCDCYLDRIGTPKPCNRETLSGRIGAVKAIMFDGDINKAIADLRGLFFDLGIRFAVVPHHKGAPVHGMTRLNADGTIDLCLTIRGSKADIFWFSLFHEIAHILNGDFVDDGVDVQTEEAEREADRLAANLLISEESYVNFLQARSFDYEDVSTLARENHVPEYIVIGRLQNDGLIGWNQYRGKIPSYKWKEEY